MEKGMADPRLGMGGGVIGGGGDDIGAMVSYIFTYRDSRTIRML